MNDYYDYGEKKQYKKQKMNDYDDRKESVMHRSAIINKAIVE